ncbi:hypothetical protein CALVIDRAFT_121101 [Calocera viscosa TUFC12733]|uniref:Uncharacterized protein n=1 Tax=Calocera viscosa (strain TUFC12733) TaxID=1330018 RepID=A0A167FD57_CALVF|nr:hypothetical protein CALVIDRAFT_121101 [Calocera viscosa TUFC12733]
MILVIERKYLREQAENDTWHPPSQALQDSLQRASGMKWPTDRYFRSGDPATLLTYFAQNRAGIQVSLETLRECLIPLLKHMDGFLLGTTATLFLENWAAGWYESDPAKRGDYPLPE